MFKAAVAIRANKKPTPWIEWCVGFTFARKIHNLQDGAKIVQNHPNNRYLWKKILSIAQIKEDRALEEIVRRIIVECNPMDSDSLSGLAEFLSAKGKILAKGKEQDACFKEAANLIEMAVNQSPTRYDLHQKRTNILATLAAFVGRWEEVHERGGNYRDLTMTMDNPESVGWKLPSN